MEFLIKKGETFARKVKIRAVGSNEGIKPDEIKSLFITLREQPYEHYPIIIQKSKKDITIDEEGFCHFVFSGDETEKLKYGKYYFDISITLNNNFRKIRFYELEITQKTTFYNGGDVSDN